MVMKLVDRIYPGQKPEPVPEPSEEDVPETEEPDSNLRIDFWYDTHTNYFIPLVVEVPKK